MKLHTIVIFCVVTARSAFMYEWAWTSFWSNDPSGPGPWALVWRHLTQGLAQLTTYCQHVVETFFPRRLMDLLHHVIDEPGVPRPA